MNDLCVEVTKRYETGLAERYRINGLEFEWTDWVLCRVKWTSDNTEHWCIASSFRGEKPGNINCTLISPTYEQMFDFTNIKRLAMFIPVEVIGISQGAVSMSKDYTYGTAADVAHRLLGDEQISHSDLIGALANAMNRIDNLERKLSRVEQAINSAALNEEKEQSQ